MAAPTLPETLIIYVLYIWSLTWKGLALWRASKQGQRNWFIAILILNTIGILELIYLFRFSKKRMSFSEIKGWFQKTFTSKPESK